MTTSDMLTGKAATAAADTAADMLPATAVALGAGAAVAAGTEWPCATPLPDRMRHHCAFFFSFFLTTKCTLRSP
jgi:hypothetical protein